MRLVKSSAVVQAGPFIGSRTGGGGTVITQAPGAGLITRLYGTGNAGLASRNDYCLMLAPSPTSNPADVGVINFNTDGSGGGWLSVGTGGAFSAVNVSQAGQLVAGFKGTSGGNFAFEGFIVPPGWYVISYLSGAAGNTTQYWNYFLQSQGI